MFLLPFISNAQSKKEQIVELQQRVDSLNAVLVNVQSQLKTTEEQLKDRVEYGKDLDLRLSQCKSTLSSTQDSLQDSAHLNAELNKTMGLKSAEIEEKKIKLEQSQTQLTLVKDSLAISQAKIIELNNQVKSLQLERDNLKLELAKQDASKSTTGINNMSLHIAFSDISGVYTIQKPIADWDFPQNTTVKIDTEKISIDAFGQLRTYDYWVSTNNGVIKISFNEISDDTGDFLGGGVIQSSKEGVRLVVSTGTEGEIEQPYAKSIKK
jgi:hypothetical protein